MSKGYVYVLANSLMVDTFKIGKTERTPKERAKELSSVTGVPTPYIVVYYILVNDCNYIEKKVHDYFKEYRINDDREFFNADIKNIIDYMIQLDSEFGINNEEVRFDNSNSFHENGVHKITGSYYDLDGYDFLGFNYEGFNRELFNIDGIHKITGTYYNVKGYDFLGLIKAEYIKLQNLTTT